ncbi:MAG: thiol:disulfide interchange protein DsbA/DsbL [Candidatus Adiutrix sp.]|jgi:thiol:disulfide interchange protein DsbA|nr:thiol:disulfide interchange protein DsbA/DsbL [Candidatus Adiutrix sp.]
MFYRILKIWVLGLAALWAWPAAAADFQPGREYVELKPHLAERSDKRIEVIEFLWYGCPHCYSVEPQVEAWAAKLPPDVNFTRLPASFNPHTEFHARIFMTLDVLKSGPEVHAKVFRIFQDEGRFINNFEELPGLARDLKLDSKAFVTAFNSPEVHDRMGALDKLMTAYDLPGVPAMVVAGKYRFDIGTARGVDGMLKLADHLIDRERLARKN